MTIKFRYEIYDVLLGTRMGTLYPREPVWVESVNGGSTWSGKVTIPPDNPILVQTLNSLTSLGNTLFIRTPEGFIPWCGFFNKRVWDPDKNELTLTAMEWRAYLYRLLATPNDDYSPITQNYTGIDQVTVARTILQTYVALGAGKGVPQIQVGANATAVARNLLMRGTLFRTIGAWIDSVANRDNGFEWDIEGTRNGAGGPVLTFQTYWPQRGGIVEGLVFRYGQGGNMLSYEPVEESNDSVVTRVWAIGAGPDTDYMPFAQDSDPDMMAGFSILRLEKATSYQDVNVQATLESHARAERDFYGVPLTLFKFAVLMDNPYIYDYYKGDRCRIQVKDRWLDLDRENVRIIERVINPETNVAVLTVDLSDVQLPDTDPEGTV